MTVGELAVQLGVPAILSIGLGGYAYYAITTHRMTHRNDLGLQVFEGHSDFIGYHIKLGVLRVLLLASAGVLVLCFFAYLVAAESGRSPLSMLQLAPATANLKPRANTARTQVERVASGLETPSAVKVAQGALTIQIDATATGRPATCDVSLGDDPEWQFADETCAFYPRADLGKGSFLLDFHSTGSKSVLVRVNGDAATLFVRDGDDETHFEEVGPLVRSSTDRACWVDSETTKVCTRAK